MLAANIAMALNTSSNVNAATSSSRVAGNRVAMMTERLLDADIGAITALQSLVSANCLSIYCQGSCQFEQLRII